MTTTIHQPTQQAMGVPPMPPEAHPRATGMDFRDLLNQALSEPGIVSQAYRRFHRYSLGNQILAAVQLNERGLPLSPIASFGRWQELGRQVRKGEKALALFMPVTIRLQEERDEEVGEVIESTATFTLFRLARNWFSLEQTEGTAYVEPMDTPAWDADLALVNLDISETRFAMVNGNVQGYAIERQIAINPLAEHPHKTRFHEVAHIVLGHTQEAGCWDTQTLSRRLQEVEAESVAFLLCAVLELPGLMESRGYIQSWLGEEELPAKSAQRIFSAAQKVLAAGRAEQD
ncbi:MAG: DUF1738 domain-containing protein [Thiobacillus sp.]|nr:DUF1738 domain-containing protein [Thiobacillus sp.]